ncbi:Ethanolamine kinase 1 [Acipenser ruthenus]|uniref:ethanolamine kinase n=1 Tax=Acipenser ruthenus TaxID=7906 RepID=A0A444V3F4_ACIRT|nr:Ethanolamine kinase 1 [Acipenser ruthenus]
METEIHVPVGSPVIRKLSICVDEHNVIPGALKLIKKLRPSWDTDRVQTKLFTDGITNKLVGCYLEECPADTLFTDGITNKLVGCYLEECPADTVLVRVYGNKTELFVDRDNELKSFQVLHANGCAPHLYCTFQNGLCYEFMQGDAMGPQHVRDPVLFSFSAAEQPVGALACLQGAALRECQLDVVTAAEFVYDSD